MTQAQARPSQWWARRLTAAAAACLLAVLAVLVPASPAAAHATLLGTDPVDGAVLETAPATVTLTFSEPVVLPPDGVRVFDAAGEEIEATAASRDDEVVGDLPDDLTEGSYVVAWRVVSADGHPIAGTLTFSIGRPSAVVAAPDVASTTDPAVTTALSVLHALTYAGLMVATGLVVFLVLVLPARAPADRARRRARLVAAAAAALAVLAAVLSSPLTVIDQQGLTVGAVLDLRTWSVTPTQLLGSLLLMLVGLVLLREATRSASGTRARVVLGLGLAAVALAPALTGHTRAASPEALVVAADALHVLAGSVWLGGLVGLALVLPALAGRASLAAEVLGRFSALAAGALVALLATGLVLTWRIVGSWSALVDSGHGQLLLAKGVLVALAVAIAAGNRFVLLPRARRDEGFDERRRVVVRVVRLAALEVVVLLGVVAVTGFLVNQPPGVSAGAAADGRTGVVEATLGEDHRVLALLEPARVGQNTLRIQLQDADGEPFEPSRTPTIDLRSPEVDLGVVRTVSDAAGTYRADVVLPSDGPWEVQVSVRLSDFDNPVAVLAFEVDAASAPDTD